MQDFLPKLPSLAEQQKKKNKKLFASLKKKTPKNLDNIVQEIHNDVFVQINCLECANCCKTLGPRITDKDIERISKYLSIKPSEFAEKYLRTDEDNDFVFKSMPCPFLLSDNACVIYEARPKACREYPHTDRRKFVQLLDITLQNTAVCPAVYKIVSELGEKFKV